ncbi:MAG: NAD(P)H-hydrate epimerase [Candidatus Thorarchaeota archaeon]
MQRIKSFLMSLPGVTKQQMIEVDRIMMEEFQVPVELMMELAGLNLARLATRYLEIDYPTISVVAGPGNNGGGGLVAARRLRSWGYDVEVFLPLGSNSVRSVPALQLSRALSVGVKMQEGLPPTSDPENASVLLDSYLGYGFKAKPDTPSDEVLKTLRNHNRVISLDTPSGLDLTTGEDHGNINPIATLTIAFPKNGLLVSDLSVTGELFLCDIGVPIDIYKDRLGLDWSSPFELESLAGLEEAFRNDSIVGVTRISHDMPSIISWQPVML